MTINPSYNVDSDLDAWHEIQALSFGKGVLAELKSHKCPSNMPPCPDCEDFAEEDDYYDRD